MPPSTPAPWHLYLVGILNILFCGMGALDFVMTMLEDEHWLANFTEEQLEYFTSFPAWLIAIWAVSVWSGVLGGVVLLAKSRLAVVALRTSLGTYILMTIINFGFGRGFELMGDSESLVMTAMIGIGVLLFLLYARWMDRRGVLA
eukprot:NODE_1614_length_1357_cov_5.223242_g1338_i0.p2 GENE.NODE_1614_length_1357_cov_5.223242_g1338_i0~~NODE_1614_length_1357_cov_5.223242_g1338_i0.p2  ORF type:complete len:145 (-),score=43.78 NODE_1614_length_1357_cov_5.223242_g1338_i0:268-702(-)